MTQNQMRRYKYIMAGLGGGLIFAVLLAVDLFTKAWAEWYEIAYGLSHIFSASSGSPIRRTAASRSGSRVTIRSS